MEQVQGQEIPEGEKQDMTNTNMKEEHTYVNVPVTTQPPLESKINLKEEQNDVDVPVVTQSPSETKIDLKEELNDVDVPVVTQPPPEAIIKRDWYQTEADVVLNILAKHIKKENVTVKFAALEIQIDAKLADDTDYNLTLPLFKSINPSESSFKVLSTKIEIKMRKLDCSSWTSLETLEAPVERRPTYPTSSKKKLDWDKLDKQIEKDTKDDDQDVNTLFSKIYNSGDENTKKAMIKSMQESGGTVLSTNWEEVGKKPVEISPPDGMEYKKWDA